MEAGLVLSVWEPADGLGKVPSLPSVSERAAGWEEPAWDDRGQILRPEARSSEVKGIQHQLHRPQMGRRKEVLGALAWQERLVPDRGASVPTHLATSGALPLSMSHSFGCHRFYVRANGHGNG